MVTSTRELLRARSPSSCVISPSEVACWASGDYRTSGQIDVYYRKPSGPRAKNPGAMAQGNLKRYQHDRVCAIATWTPLRKDKTYDPLGQAGVAGLYCGRQ